MNIEILKHGEIDVKILICNRAYESATIRTKKELDLDDFEGDLQNYSISRLMINYLYESYVCYCQEKQISKKWGIISFQEELNNKAIEESTLDDCFQKLADSLSSHFEKVAKSMEEDSKKKESTEMNTNLKTETNLNLSIVENAE